MCCSIGNIKLIIELLFKNEVFLCNPTIFHVEGNETKHMKSVWRVSNPTRPTGCKSNQSRKDESGGRILRDKLQVHSWCQPGCTREEFPEPSPDCGTINLETVLASESFKKFHRLNQGARLRESRQYDGGRLGLSYWVWLHDCSYKMKTQRESF